MKKDNPRYKITFTGNILPGHTVSEVSMRFSDAFKLQNKSYLQQLFSGKIVTLKRDLTYEKAQHYSLILEKLGADCCIERSQDCSFDAFDAETDDSYKRKKRQPLVQIGPSSLTNVELVPK